MIKEAIVVAGGLGTRLQSVVPDLPKTMADVNGRPFIYYVIQQLRSEGIERFIFAIGYKHEAITEYLATEFPTLNYECSIEREPLGTGGAILAACYKTSTPDVLVTNGDTLFKAYIKGPSVQHQRELAHCTIFLKTMENFSRYGTVEIDENNRILSFSEKTYKEKGLINGGMYILNVPAFMEEQLPEKFSFEKDYLEKFAKSRTFIGISSAAYFIDIGIPEDYEKAKIDFKIPQLDLRKIDKSWTLFLDRDGVINHEKKDEYVLSWDEFKFYEGAVDAIARLSKKFGRVFIVTNQRGVSKGLMTENDLTLIHARMMEEIIRKGGRIDHIYYCTSLDDKHPDRKCNPGMAFRARADFEVDLRRSIIAGNKLSDMKFGRHAGIYTAFIATTNPEIPDPHPDIDVRFNSLSDFGKAF